MPTFGKRSLLNLSQCHVLLRKVMIEAIKELDFSIIQGYRGSEDQEKAFREGKSKAHYGQSAHNYLPCIAVDCIPFPFLGWEDAASFKRMADHILLCAASLDIPVQWGGNWKTLKDTPHFELTPWRSYVKGNTNG